MPFRVLNTERRKARLNFSKVYSMLPAEEFKMLAIKYWENTIRSQERERLEQIMAESTELKKLFDSLSDPKLLKNELVALGESATLWRQLGIKKLNPVYVNRISQIRKVWYSIAAAAMIILVFTIVVRLQNGSSQKQKSANESLIRDEVSTGSSNATLTLANGSVIQLDPAKANSFQQGNTMIRNANGQLDYNDITAGSAPDVLLNTLTTPTGGIYRVRLPDGTAVTLNAASQLIYPTQFVEKERRVRLQGEAFFEVVKDANHPFLVESDGNVVQVLGTEFVVANYPNDHAPIITLLSGSVQITAGDDKKTLKPNQQAILFSKNIEVKEVEAFKSTAWTRGLFYFDHTRIDQACRQLERWYGVSFEYEGNVKSEAEAIMGTIERILPLNTSLEILHNIARVDFEIKGRKIIVRKAKD